MECRVYLSAFNHADTNAILRAIDQAPWRDKEMVQVFVKNRRKKSFGFGTPVVEASDDECNRLLTTVIFPDSVSADNCGICNSHANSL
jgi:hypothetical protein